YANAVVNNSVTEVKNLINEGKFDRARKSVESTMQVIKNNRKDLGEELFQQYVGELEQLTQQIIAGEQGRAEELKQQQVEVMKKQLEQQENALAQQAVEYISQKQYDQALETLKSLLNIRNMQLDGEVVK